MSDGTSLLSANLLAGQPQPLPPNIVVDRSGQLYLQVDQDWYRVGNSGFLSPETVETLEFVADSLESPFFDPPSTLRVVIPPSITLPWNTIPPPPRKPMQEKIGAASIYCYKPVPSNESGAQPEPASAPASAPSAAPSAAPPPLPPLPPTTVVHFPSLTPATTPLLDLLVLDCRDQLPRSVALTPAPPASLQVVAAERHLGDVVRTVRRAALRRGVVAVVSDEQVDNGVSGGGSSTSSWANVVAPSTATATATATADRVVDRPASTGTAVDTVMRPTSSLTLSSSSTHAHSVPPSAPALTPTPAPAPAPTPVAVSSMIQDRSVPAAPADHPKFDHCIVVRVNQQYPYVFAATCIFTPDPVTGVLHSQMVTHDAVMVTLPASAPRPPLAAVFAGLVANTLALLTNSYNSRVLCLLSDSKSVRSLEKQRFTDIPQKTIQEYVEITVKKQIKLVFAQFMSNSTILDVLTSRNTTSDRLLCEHHIREQRQTRPFFTITVAKSETFNEDVRFSANDFGISRIIPGNLTRFAWFAPLYMNKCEWYDCPHKAVTAPAAVLGGDRAVVEASISGGTSTSSTSSTTTSTTSTYPDTTSTYPDTTVEPDTSTYEHHPAPAPAGPARAGLGFGFGATTRPSYELHSIERAAPAAPTAAPAPAGLFSHYSLPPPPVSAPAAGPGSLYPTFTQPPAPPANTLVPVTPATNPFAPAPAPAPVAAQAYSQPLEIGTKRPLEIGTKSMFDYCLAIRVNAKNGLVFAATCIFTPDPVTGVLHSQMVTHDAVMVTLPASAPRPPLAAVFAGLVAQAVANIPIPHGSRVLCLLSDSQCVKSLTSQQLKELPDETRLDYLRTTKGREITLTFAHFDSSGTVLDVLTTQSPDNKALCGNHLRQQRLPRPLSTITINGSLDVTPTFATKDTGLGRISKGRLGTLPWLRPLNMHRCTVGKCQSPAIGASNAKVPQQEQRQGQDVEQLTAAAWAKTNTTTTIGAFNTVATPTPFGAQPPTQPLSPAPAPAAPAPAPALDYDHCLAVRVNIMHGLIFAATCVFSPDHDRGLLRSQLVTHDAVRVTDTPAPSLETVFASVVAGSLYRAGLYNCRVLCLLSDSKVAKSLAKKPFSEMNEKPMIYFNKILSGRQFDLTFAHFSSSSTILDVLSLRGMNSSRSLCKDHLSMQRRPLPLSNIQVSNAVPLDSPVKFSDQDLGTSRIVSGGLTLYSGFKMVKMAHCEIGKCHNESITKLATDQEEQEVVVREQEQEHEQVQVLSVPDSLWDEEAAAAAAPSQVIEVVSEVQALHEAIDQPTVAAPAPAPAPIPAAPAPASAAATPAAATPAPAPAPAEAPIFPYVSKIQAGAARECVRRIEDDEDFSFTDDL